MRNPKEDLKKAWEEEQAEKYQELNDCWNELKENKERQQPRDEEDDDDCCYDREEAESIAWEDM